MDSAWWEKVQTPTEAERDADVASLRAALALAAPRIVAETLRRIVAEAERLGKTSVTLNLLDLLADDAEHRTEGKTAPLCIACGKRKEKCDGC